MLSVSLHAYEENKYKMLCMESGRYTIAKEHERRNRMNHRGDKLNPISNQSVHSLYESIHPLFVEVMIRNMVFNRDLHATLQVYDRGHYLAWTAEVLMSCDAAAGSRSRSRSHFH